MDRLQDPVLDEYDRHGAEGEDRNNDDQVNHDPLSNALLGK